MADHPTTQPTDHPTGSDRSGPTTAPKAGGRFVTWIAFWLGVVGSIAANIAHTAVPTTESVAAWTATGQSAAEWHPPVGAMLAAGFAPVALMLVIEIWSRVPWPTGTRWVVGRWIGSGLVASVAAVVSYRHMRGLLIAYGEPKLTATIMPLAVDGLMVVASIALMALSHAKRSAPTAQVTAPTVPTARPAVAKRVRPTATPPPAVVTAPTVADRTNGSAPTTAPDPTAVNGRPVAQAPTRPTGTRPVRLVRTPTTHGPTAIADATFLRTTYGDDQSADRFPGRNELWRRHGGNLERWSKALHAHRDRADQSTTTPDQTAPAEPDREDSPAAPIGAIA